MVKEKQLEDYLQACKDADVSDIDNNPVLMKMFNTRDNYWAHLNNIIKHIGPLDGLRICEIGGGYGAMAMLISKCRPECYHIIDLPEVCELQNRYLDGSSVECLTEPTGQFYDLCISNYALSEIVDNKLYIDEVLKRSKHGYITCNTDFVTLLWPHRKYPDIQGERGTNYILVW